MIARIASPTPLAPASAVFSAELPELVFLLEPDKMLTNPPCPDPETSPKRLKIHPEMPTLPYFNIREYPLPTFD